jgi:acyl carrier protein
MWDNTVTQPADVRARALQIIGAHMGLDPGYFADNHSFVDTLGADSLEMIELVIMLENEFDIELSDADLDQAATVGAMLDLVERAVNQ